jgi:predicted AlkP superfamily phosphohydrolase/phosphomutase
MNSPARRGPERAPRVLVIGWDGGDWRLLQPLIEQGALPNLRRWLDRAAHGRHFVVEDPAREHLARAVRGELISTVPPVTAAAWASFMTGCWPSRHGLLGWQLPLDKGLKRPWINATAIQAPTIWEILSRAGKRLGALNVPLTYPPPSLNGELVSGMLTPSVAANFTHPPELKDALLGALPGYVLDVEMQRTERDTRSAPGVRRFLDELELALNYRERALEFLWERGPFDFFMIVLETPDRLQHALYQFASGQPAESRADWYAVRKRVNALYSRCDAILGWLLDRSDEETMVILLSDHGFGPLRAVWHLNDWLAAEGYMRWAAETPRSSRVVGTLRGIVGSAKHRLPARWVERGRATLAPINAMDWPATVAYAGLPTEEGIWLNVRGREPLGIVEPRSAYEQLRDELISAVQAFRDPHTGEPVVERAQRREEVHRGPFAGRAPDIVLTLRGGYKITPKRSIYRAPNPLLGSIKNVEAEGRGIHRRQGMIAMAGPQVLREGLVQGATLPDLLPTILAAFGLAAPPGLDGRPLIRAGMAEPDTRARPAHPPGESAGSSPSPVSDSAGPPERFTAFTEEEAALVEARLADLGYLE